VEPRLVNTNTNLAGDQKVLGSNCITFGATLDPELPHHIVKTPFIG